MKFLTCLHLLPGTTSGRKMVWSVSKKDVQVFYCTECFERHDISEVPVRDVPASYGEMLVASKSKVVN